jgi:hypothetical protein
MRHSLITPLNSMIKLVGEEFFKKVVVEFNINNMFEIMRQIYFMESVTMTMFSTELYKKLDVYE